MSDPSVEDSLYMIDKQDQEFCMKISTRFYTFYTVKPKQELYTAKNFGSSEFLVEEHEYKLRWLGFSLPLHCFALFNHDQLAPFIVFRAAFGRFCDAVASPNTSIDICKVVEWREAAERLREPQRSEFLLLKGMLFH